MITSHSTDFLIRLKNASLAGRKQFTAPFSGFCQAIAALLKKNHFIDDFSVTDSAKKEIIVKVGYQDNIPLITGITLMSKPGRRHFEKVSAIPWGNTKNSLIIISTSHGVMSQKEAKKLGIGGELVAEIW